MVLRAAPRLRAGLKAGLKAEHKAELARVVKDLVVPREVEPARNQNRSPSSQSDGMMAFYNFLPQHSKRCLQRP